MEQEQEHDNQARQPLYYIEQPDLTPLSEQGQTVSVRKNIGEQPKKKSSSKKEKNSRSKKRQSDVETSQSTEEYEESTVETKQENVEEEGTTDEEFVPANKKVKEMVEYLESLPHFIQPIIACETKDKYVQGTLLQSADGEVKIKDRRSLASKIIKEEEITEMYIVSL